jgi:hypothetical protein
LVWLVLRVLGVVIALRIGLKLIGANPESPIAALIYGLTSTFFFPFARLVSSPTAGNMLLEPSPLFAVLVYGLIAWAIVKLVWLIFRRPPGPVVDTTQTTTSQRHTTPRT